jgi:hypothetical protein
MKLFFETNLVVIGCLWNNANIVVKRGLVPIIAFLMSGYTVCELLPQTTTRDKSAILDSVFCANTEYALFWSSLESAAKFSLGIPLAL